MESLYRLKDLLCDQVDEIVEKNDITPVELDRVYKVVDVIKDVYTIEAMENAEEDWDEEGSYAGGGYSRAGRGYSRAGRGGSYRGSYDGGYSRRRGYSRAGRGGGSYRMSYDEPIATETKEQMMQQISDMQHKIDMM